MSQLQTWFGHSAISSGFRYAGWTACRRRSRTSSTEPRIRSMVGTEARYTPSSRSVALRRRHVHEALGAQHLAHPLSLRLAQRPWLRPRRLRRRTRPGWALGVPAVVRGGPPAHRRAGRRGAHHRRQLRDRLIDHLVSSLATSAPSDASSSKSAESSPWTRITLRTLTSSPSSRWSSRRSCWFSHSRGAAGGRPRGGESASSAPLSRCLRHSEINELYSPSRRSSAPLPCLFSDSYWFRMSSL